MFSTRRGEYNVANLGYESIWCRWWLRWCAQSNAIIWPRGAGRGGGEAGDRIINTDLLDLSTNRYRSRLLRINLSIWCFVFWRLLYDLYYTIYCTIVLLYCILYFADWRLLYDWLLVGILLLLRADDIIILFHCPLDSACIAGTKHEEDEISLTRLQYV